MTDHSIEAINATIAVFDGLITFNGTAWIKDGVMILELKYHSSWSELMPVVEKIEAIGFNVQIGNNCFCTISKFEDEDDPFEGIYISTEVDPLFGRVESKIHGVFLAVYQFIQWYNHNKKP